MSVETKKIKIGITQKMNLGNYETQDYYIGLEIEGFNPQSSAEVQDAIDYGRGLCFKNISEYYEHVRGEKLKSISEEKKKNKKVLSLEDKIESATTEKELRDAEEEVLEIEDVKLKKLLLKKYNLKLISLKENG